ncbi:MAG: hypothetical protein II938_00510 [Alphaproteobacteria bacterium]|nr:hypothetical protein [Alphaproteobacteria bacterium]
MKNKLVLVLCVFLMSCTNTKLQAIKGKDASEMITTKGNPVTKIGENGREMWTYRYENCTEMVFFDVDGNVIDLHELGECPLPE